VQSAASDAQMASQRTWQQKGSATQTCVQQQLSAQEGLSWATEQSPAPASPQA